MKLRPVLFAAIVLLLVACAPATPDVSLGEDVQPSAAGIGVCHWISSEGLPDAVDFGTESTAVVHWKNLEPVRGQFNFERVDKYVTRRQDGSVKVLFGIQTYGADLAGLPKAPQWLIDEGAVWHNPCGNYKAIFAPWDAVYLRRLEVLLSAFNDHIASQSAAYRDTIGGIVMMSGGVYGETHLYEWDPVCNLEPVLTDYYNLGHLTPHQFDEAYAESVLRILDRYMVAFPDWPIMVQLGRPSADEWLMRYGSATYPGRFYAKWQGWSPTNVGDGRDDARRRGNEYYGALFRAYYGKVPSGFEPAHPIQDWLGPEQYLNAMEWAVRAKVSYVCFQAGKTLWGAYALPEWAVFDAQLEANAIGVVPVPTVVPTGTPAPVITSTSTSTPTATLTATASPTATNVPTAPPAPVRWLCECRQVTVTVTPVP